MSPLRWPAYEAFAQDASFAGFIHRHHAPSRQIGNLGWVSVVASVHQQPRGGYTCIAAENP
ncbi:hypothetical protein LOK85_12330 [Xylella fastidiosa subsp. multiplex]|uniref:hypothetical protein n=1 Tax=Xylella fastidiosa TaxID=2371 RepID=UPI00234D6958|nr:hypothetical protein [Xylella fastidiosa]MDC6416659.1 hypothetical protein [Xylella fastidiosa subsp. multiplex]